MSQTQKPAELYRVEYGARYDHTSGMTPFHHEDDCRYGKKIYENR